MSDFKSSKFITGQEIEDALEKGDSSLQPSDLKSPLLPDNKIVTENSIPLATEDKIGGVTIYFDGFDLYIRNDGQNANPNA